MSKAYITDYVTDPNVEREVLSDALVAQPSPEVEVIIVWHEKIDAAFLDRFPRLRGVVRYGVGFDNLDLNELKSRGIYACNTPDYGVDEVSDTAIAMILNIARGISRYDYLCREFTTTWQENTLTGIKRTSATKLGVVGAGRIGGSVLLKARALGFQTVFVDPDKPQGHEKMLGAERRETLEEVLAESDLVSLHLPLSNVTRGLVNPDFLRLMKPGASLVNTARGGLIDNLDNFYDPLQSGRLLCVGLDVIPTEPPGPDGRLINAWRRREPWLEGRLIINPHTAYFSDKAYWEMRHKAAANARRILEGKKPWNIVNGLDYQPG